MLKIKNGLFIIIIILVCAYPVSAEEREPADLEKIIVTKHNLYLAQPYSLNSGELESLPFSSSVEALSTLPVDLQSRQPHNGIQTDFSLRGSNFQDVLLLLNGQRINDPQTAHHNSDIPFTSEDINKIEVMPGVSSSLFGPDAIGGAVNFILKRPQERKFVLESTGGQHGSFSGLISASDKIKGLGVRLSVENQQSSGYREDTDFKKFTTSFGSSLDLPQGSFDLNFGFQEKEFGAYDFYTPGQGYPSKEWTRTYLLDSGFNLNKGDLIIKPNFIWRRHFDKFMLDKTGARSNFVSNHRTDTYTPGIYFQKEAGVLGKVGLGLEYGQERITSTTLGNHSRDHQSVFFDDACDLTPKLSSGLSFRFDDFSGFGKVYTGSFNLRYEIVEQQFLRLGVSRSMREPSFTELYYNDHTTTVGNSSLSSEKSLNYEAGYEIKKDKLFAGSTLFLRQENDFIDWVKSVAGSGSDYFQAENIPGANVFGIESRLELELSENINLKTNYTYINKSVNDNGYLYKYGQNYSRHLLNSELIFKIPFITQSLGFTYKKKPGRNGWFLLNSRTNYPINKDVEVFLSITNILNVEYQEIEGIPQSGRWIEGGLRFEW